MSEIPLHSPGELLSDMEPLDDDDLSPDFQAKARTGDGSPVKGARGEALGADGKEGGEADWDWRVALKQLTGQQLKAWIKDGLARADERMAAEGRDAERKAFSLLKRHALCVPSITMFMAGAKVSNSHHRCTHSSCRSDVFQFAYFRLRMMASRMSASQ